MQLEFTGRQGDIALFRVLDGWRPEAVQPSPRDKHGLVLARGSATGHEHRINGRRAQIYPLSDVEINVIAATSARELAGRDPTILRYLEIGGEEPAILRHDEHAPITLAPGGYLVARQVEYTPAEIVAVAD
jgi:hypothetical protein